MSSAPTTSATSATSSTSLADLPALLRRARVDGEPVVVHGAGALRVLKRGVVTLDGNNAIGEIDGTVTLAHAARVLQRAGAIFPVARPLPPLTLMQACAALPFFVDAFVQHASIITGEGDAADTPRAPRAAAGPSLLGALCARPPLAVAARARVRVMLARHARVRREVHGSTRAAAERVRTLLDDGRPFSVDAFGTTVLVLDGTPHDSTSNANTSNANTSNAASDRFAHAGAGRRARFDDAHSLTPSDVDAIAHALDAGGRVLAAPFMGRCATLFRARSAPSIALRSLTDTTQAVAALTSSWSRLENT